MNLCENIEKMEKNDYDVINKYYRTTSEKQIMTNFNKEQWNAIDINIIIQHITDYIFENCGVLSVDLKKKSKSFLIECIEKYKIPYNAYIEVVELPSTKLTCDKLREIIKNELAKHGECIALSKMTKSVLIQYAVYLKLDITIESYLISKEKKKIRITQAVERFIKNLED